MLKSYWRIISYLERIGDNALIIGAFFASYYLRDYLLIAANATALPFPQELKELASIDRYFIVLGVALPLYNALLSMLGAYRSMRFIRWFALLRISVTASALCFLCLGATLFLLKLDLSRSFIATFTIVSGMGLFLLRVLVLSLLRFFRVRGKNFRNLLVVGTGVQARKLYLEIARQPDLGVRVCGFVDVHESRFEQYVEEEDSGESEEREENDPQLEAADSAVYDLPARVVANLESFEAALKKYAVDEVIFTEVVGNFSAVHELARIAAEEGVRVTLVADLFSLEIFQSDVSYFGKLPLIHYNPSPAGVDSPALVVKRMMDVVLSASALVVLSPLMLLVAVLIKLTSAGPVFFRQRRMGLNGRIFTLLKFRSMIENAESMLEELRAKNEMSGPVFKLKDDPRVTPHWSFYSSLQYR